MGDMKGTGVGIKEITDMITAQQTKLAKGAVGVSKAMGENAQKILDLKAELKDAQDDEGEGAGQKVIEIQEKLKKATVNSSAEFDRLSRIELNAFNTLIASGVGSVEAMSQVGEGIDNLVAGSQAFGYAGGAAFQELKRWRELTTTNASLLSQVGNLNDMMVASMNLGGLTRDAFADLASQGQDAFKQLTAAGLTQQEAEAAMKPLLENIIKLHEERGYAIDDETQKLIDQATEDGVLSAQKVDAAKIQLDLMASLVTAVGGTLPESYRKMADAAIEANKKVADSTGTSQKAIEGVSTGLANTDWGGWATEAEKAAAAAQEAVDHVSFGSSPGGIKEIPLKLMEAIQSFKAFKVVGVESAETVQEAVDGMTDGGSSDMVAMHVTEAAEALNDAAIQAQESMKAMQADMAPVAAAAQPMSKHEMVLARKAQQATGMAGAVANAMSSALPPITFEVSAIDADDVTKAVNKKIGPAMLAFLRRNQGASKTQLQQILGT
jgi:hypothetical protein